MTDAALKSEIERIATLRGRPAASYAITARDAAWAERKLNRVLTDRIFQPNPNATEDLYASDELPACLRELVRNSPVMICAGYIGALVSIVDGEAQLLCDLLKARYPQLSGAEDTAPKRTTKARGG